MSSNPLEKYLLEHYDRAGGTMGVVDPPEREEFYNEELHRLQPDLPGLKDLSDNPQAVERLFKKWTSKPKFQAPYLSGLKLEEFKAALLGQREAGQANAAAMRIGDNRISKRFNSQGTVMRARKAGDIPREGMAFKANDPSRPVRFTMALESVNAYVRPDGQKGAASTMLRPCTVYIVPQGYNGRVPPTEQEMADWRKKAGWPNMSSDPGKYFLAIVAGATSAKSSQVSEQGYVNFTYDVVMPPGSYEVHAVSGEFEGSDFDNFDISVTGYNTEVDTAKKPVDIRLAPEGETRDADRRSFVREVVETAKKQGGGEGVKDKRVGIVFVIDHSGSMRPAAEMVRDSVNSIVDGLRKGGAREVMFSVVVFNDTQSIDTLMPLTKMDDESIGKLRATINGLAFDGGTEPVGEAVLHGMSLLEGSTAESRLAVLVTDNDGLEQDKLAAPVLSDEVVRKVIDSGIVVSIQNSNDWLMSRFLGGDGKQSMKDIVSGRLLEYLRANPNLKPEDRKKIIEAAVDLARYNVEVATWGVGILPSSLEVAKGLLLSCDRGLAADVMKEVMWDGDYAGDSDRFAIALELALEGDRDGVDFLINLPEKFEFRRFDANILEKVASLGEPEGKNILATVAARSDCPSRIRIDAAKLLAGYDKEAAIEALRSMIRDSEEYLDAMDLVLSYDGSLKTAVRKDIMKNRYVHPQDCFATALNLALEGDKDGIDFLNDIPHRFNLSFLDVPTVEKLEPLGDAVKGIVKTIATSYVCQYAVRIRAAKIIGKGDPAEACRIFKELLYKHDVALRDRVEAAIELYSMDDRAGAYYFVQGLPLRPDLSSVDMSTLQRIASVGDMARKTLCSIVKSPDCDVGVRIEAANILAGFDKKAAVESLKEVLLSSEGNYGVFGKVLASIDQVQAKAFFHELFLNSEEHARRVEVALALAPMEDKEAIDFLRREAPTSPRVEDIIDALLSGGVLCLEAVRDMAVKGRPDEKAIVTGAIINRLDKGRPASEAATEFLIADIFMLLNRKLAVYTLERWCREDNPIGVRFASAVRILPHDSEAAIATLTEISKSDDVHYAAKAQEILKEQSKQ